MSRRVKRQKLPKARARLGFLARAYAYFRPADNVMNWLWRRPTFVFLITAANAGGFVDHVWSGTWLLVPIYGLFTVLGAGALVRLLCESK